MRSAFVLVLLACVAAAALAQPVDLYGQPIAPVVRPTAKSPLPEPQPIATQMQAQAQGAMQPGAIPAATQPAPIAAGAAATAAAPTVVPQGSMMGPDGKVYQLDAAGFPIIPTPRNHITAAVIADMAKEQEMAEKAKATAQQKPQEAVQAAPALPKLTATEEALIARLTGSLAPIQAEPVQGASLLEVSTRFRQPSSGLSPEDLAQEALDKAAEAAEKAAAERDLAEQKADQVAAQKDLIILQSSMAPDVPPPATTPAPTPAPPAPTGPTLVKPTIDEKIVPLPDEPEAPKNTSLAHLQPCPANSTLDASLMELDAEAEQAPADGLTEAERREEAADRAAEAKDKAEAVKDKITLGPKLVKPVIDEKVVPLPEAPEVKTNASLSHLPPCPANSTTASLMEVESESEAEAETEVDAEAETETESESEQAPAEGLTEAERRQEALDKAADEADKAAEAKDLAEQKADQVAAQKDLVILQSSMAPDVPPPPPTPTPLPTPPPATPTPAPPAGPKMIKPVIDENVVPLPEVPEVKKDTTLAHLPPCEKPAAAPAAPAPTPAPVAPATLTAAIIEPQLFPPSPLPEPVPAAPIATLVVEPVEPQLWPPSPVPAANPASEPSVQTVVSVQAVASVQQPKLVRPVIQTELAASTVVYNFQSLLEESSSPKLVKPVIDEKVVPLPELPEVKKDAALAHLQPCPANSTLDAALVELDAEAEPKLVKPVIDEKVVPLPEVPEIKKDASLSHLQPCPAEAPAAKASLMEVDSESESEAEAEVDAEAETEVETETETEAEAEAEAESEQSPSSDGLTDADRRQAALDKAADAADKAAEAKDLAEQKSDAAKAVEDAKVLAASMAPDVPPKAAPASPTPTPAPPTPPIPAAPVAPAAPAAPKMVRPVIQDDVIAAPEPVAPPAPVPCPKRRFRAAKVARKVPVDVVVQVPTVEYVPVDVVHYVPQPDVIQHAFYTSHPAGAQPILMEMQATAQSQAELEADADAQAEIAAQAAAELDASVEAQTDGEGEAEAEAETEVAAEAEGEAAAEGEVAAEGEAESEGEAEADAESDGALTADSDPKLIFSRRRHVRRALPEPDRGLAPQEHPAAKHFVDAQAWEQKTTIGNEGGIMHGYHDPKLPAKAWAFWKSD